MWLEYLSINLNPISNFRQYNHRSAFTTAQNPNLTWTYHQGKWQLLLSRMVADLHTELLGTTKATPNRQSFNSPLSPLLYLYLLTPACIGNCRLLVILQPSCQHWLSLGHYDTSLITTPLQLTY